MAMNIQLFRVIVLLAFSSIGFSQVETNSALLDVNSYRRIPIHTFTKIWKYLDILGIYEFLQSYSGTYRYHMLLSEFFGEDPAIEDHFIKQRNAFSKLFFFCFLFLRIFR